MKSYPTVGKHYLAFEEPDILFMRLNGSVSQDEGSEINRLHREIGVGRDHIFFLVDLKGLDSIHPSVRKESGEVLRELPLRGAAIYQASFKARVIAKLIITAMNLFRNEEERRRSSSSTPRRKRAPGSRCGAARSPPPRSPPDLTRRFPA